MNPLRRNWIHLCERDYDPDGVGHEVRWFYEERYGRLGKWLGPGLNAADKPIRVTLQYNDGSRLEIATDPKNFTPTPQ